LPLFGIFGCLGSGPAAKTDGKEIKPISAREKAALPPPSRLHPSHWRKSNVKWQLRRWKERRDFGLKRHFGLKRQDAPSGLKMRLSQALSYE
jgi:hypothetical protein